MIFKNLSAYLSQTRLDAVYDHICVFLVLFSDFREGVDPNLVVEGEGDQGLPVLLRHLPGHPGELVARHVRPQGWQGIRCGCQEVGACLHSPALRHSLARWRRLPALAIRAN